MLVAGLRIDGIVAPMVIDRAKNGQILLAYIRNVFAPTLRPGDIVVMDNLSCHKIEGVEEAIKERGASLRYLPPYSPDLNPIEIAFSKLKSHLRKAAETTVTGLWNATGRILDLFKPEE